MANPNWVTGVSGNPKGRPPKKRTFAVLLERALAKKFQGMPRKRMWLDMLAQALSEGIIQFPGDTVTSKLSIETWAALSFKALAHLEPPPKQIEITGENGDPIEVVEIVKAYDKPDRDTGA